MTFHIGLYLVEDITTTCRPSNAFQLTQAGSQIYVCEYLLLLLLLLRGSVETETKRLKESNDER